MNLATKKWITRAKHYIKTLKQNPQAAAKYRMQFAAKCSEFDKAVNQVIKENL